MKIKLKTALLLVVAVGACYAREVRLAWDKSLDPSVIGYRLYASTNTITDVSNAPVRVDVSTNTTGIVDIPDGGTWHFVATAYNAELESLPSNEVIVEVPQAPLNMRTLQMQWSGTFTNSNNGGSFLIKIQTLP